MSAFGNCEKDNLEYEIRIFLETHKISELLDVVRYCVENKEKGIRFGVDNGSMFDKWIADHDKQIRDEVINELLQQVEFEEKWLSDAWEENGYNYSSSDVDIAFSGIKHKLRQIKEEQNE